MTWVTFDLGISAEGGEGLDLGVPVEVRDGSMTLIARTPANRGIELEPGTYLVAAKMPAGQSLTRIVKVGTEQQVLNLSPDAAAPARAWRGGIDYVESPRARVAAARLPEVKTQRRAIIEETLPAARLRMFRGNPLSGSVAEITPALTAVPHAANVVRLSLDAADETRFVQCLQAGRPPVTIAVPTSSRSGATIVIYRERTRYWVELVPQNDQASLLLGYRQNHAAEQQATIAETMLQRKMADPIAAAVGSYSLLRFGELQRLHDWTKNLCERFPALPDGASIYGEHLARLGRHAEAIETFGLLVARGLPIFSDGLRFLLERLKLYADSELRGAAGGLQERFERYFRALDFDKAVTTFAGHPADPDRSRSVTMAEVPEVGFDVRDWFSPVTADPDR